jgi:CBS domain containing-hemolysin-like protein
MALLVITVFLALAISFVCSLCEAVLLSGSIGELEDRRSKGDRGAGILLELKQKRIDDAITAILTLNTIAHTAGTSFAGAQAAKVLGNDEWTIGIFSASLVAVVLVGTEIIPKTLGTVYATALSGIAGRGIKAMMLVVAPLLAFTRLITGALSSGERASVSRGELAAMVAIAAQEGTLRSDDSRLVSNALRYHQIKVEDVMTPRTVVVMVQADTPISSLIHDDRLRVFSRIPVYEGSRDNVIGYILLREVLSALARGVSSKVPVSRFVRKVAFIPEGASLDRALRRLTESREHMALVGDEFGGLAGLLTLEDLMETLLGIEILDESDRVADLRGEAAQLRERRLEEQRSRNSAEEAAERERAARAAAEAG